MHEKAAFVFWITLGLYLLTLFTASYVGVYLTYIAIPIIALSGLLMKLTKPKKETQETYDLLKKEGRELRGMSISALEQINESLDDVNRRIAEKNRRDAEAKRTSEKGL